MDVHITYETLFDLLRKERSLNELQALDKLFWLHVVDYMKERKHFLEKTSMIEQEKTRLQLQNIRRIVKEIYELRERKIMNLAVNVVRSEQQGFVDTKNMLLEERKLYDEATNLLTEYKKGTLTQVFNLEYPTIAEHDVKEHAKKALAQKKEKPASQAVSSSSENDSEQQTADSSKAVNGPQANLEVAADHLQVKFVQAVPKFLGKEKEVYGPYDVGAVVALPDNIAQILLRKGKAEEI